MSYFRLDFGGGHGSVEPTASARWQSVLSQLDAATRAIGDAGSSHGIRTALAGTASTGTP